MTAKLAAATSTPPADFEIRISDVRDNIRELIEQAAAYSGADEARSAVRIAEQGTLLVGLLREREAQSA